MKKIFPLIIACCAPLVAMAQNPNMNHTVQVVNTYDNNLVQVERPQPEITVPDSLYHFDLNFDYNGFETPYKGNSEFNPYFTELELAKRPYDGRKLYLKAGAGYNFAPVLDVYASILDKGRFKMGAHVDGDAFYGRHRTIGFTEDEMLPVKGATWLGYDAKTLAGVDARADWDKVSMLIRADYEGVFADGAPGPVRGIKMYNGAKADMVLDSNFDLARNWRFSLGLSYAYGNALSTMGGFMKEDVTEHMAAVRIFGRRDFRKGSALDFQVDVNGVYNKDDVGMDHHGYVVQVTPRYFLTRNKFHMGVGLGFMVTGGKNLGGFNSEVPLYVWPSMDLLWKPFGDKFDVYAEAGMKGEMYGVRADALSSRFPILYGKDADYSHVRTFGVKAGFKGSVAKCFDYNLYGGFETVHNEPLFCIEDRGFVYGRMVTLIHENTNKGVFGASFSAHAGGFEAEAGVRYNLFAGQENMVSVPSVLTANFDMSYLFMGRLKAGVGVDYRSSYKAGDYAAPYIVDLRAKAEYKVSSMLGVFLSGSNLLNRSPQYIPSYAREGVCITAGVVLNL